MRPRRRRSAAKSAGSAVGSSALYGYRTTFATANGGQIVPTGIRLHR
ncbi:hypothetical protein ACFY4B_26135 [Kitasatospora sp. NPDC001261]